LRFYKRVGPMFLLLETWRLEGWVDSRELAHLLMLDLAYLLREVWFGSVVESRVCWSAEYEMWCMAKKVTS